MLQQTKHQNFDVANCGYSLAQTMALWLYRRMEWLVVPVVVMEYMARYFGHALDHNHMR